MLIRISHSTGVIAIIGLMLLLMTCAGCTVQKQDFDGRDPAEVWIAMKAAANTPDYATGDITKRWTVMLNQVLVEEESKNIEILRRVKRDLVRHGAKPMREERVWKLRATLIENKTGDPQIEFTSRGMAVPAHARIEADRYFRDVSHILGISPPQQEPLPVEQPDRHAPSYEE